MERKPLYTDEVKTHDALENSSFQKYIWPQLSKSANFLMTTYLQTNFWNEMQTAEELDVPDCTWTDFLFWSLISQQTHASYHTQDPQIEPDNSL